MNWFKNFFKQKPIEPPSNEYTKSGKCWKDGLVFAYDMLPNNEILFTTMDYKEFSYITYKTDSSSDTLKIVELARHTRELDGGLRNHISQFIIAWRDNGQI